MFEYILIAVCTFLASFLSFYSGFGLGTILMPVVAVFLPLPIAIGITAIVHLFHNLLKSGLLWKSIDWSIVLRFGSAAISAAIFGALLLEHLSRLSPIKKYTIFSIHGEVSILHITIGLLLILFATMEALPNKIFKFRNLFLGGAVSGFFGGLTGNQGAFRSMFLVNMHLDKRAFIATNALIATEVDVVRLIIYGLSFGQLFMSISLSFLGIATLGAAGGVILGMTLLHKITIRFIQKSITCLLYVLGILLALGVI